LVFHQDKDGNMIGGGYHINNLLYQHKMPLFVSMSGGNGNGNGNGSNDHPDHDDAPNQHVVPEKFSDLFKDLAIPAGLFMMPSLFKPRNYAFEVPEEEPIKDYDRDHDRDHDRVHDDQDLDDDDDTDDDDDVDNRHTTKPVPRDIFDTLLSLVERKDRIQHDVKTRRHRSVGGKKNKTRRI